MLKTPVRQLSSYYPFILSKIGAKKSAREDSLVLETEYHMIQLWTHGRNYASAVRAHLSTNISPEDTSQATEGMQGH